MNKEELLARKAALEASYLFSMGEPWPLDDLGDPADYFLAHQTGGFTVSGDAGLIYVAGFEVDEQVISVRLVVGDIIEPIKGMGALDVRSTSVEILWT